MNNIERLPCASDLDGWTVIDSPSQEGSEYEEGSAIVAQLDPEFVLVDRLIQQDPECVHAEGWALVDRLIQQGCKCTNEDVKAIIQKGGVSYFRSKQSDPLDLDAFEKLKTSIKKNNSSEIIIPLIEEIKKINAYFKVNLLNEHIDCDDGEMQSCSMLQVASKLDRLDVIQALVEATHSLTEPGETTTWLTALAVAVRCEHRDDVKRLIESGARPQGNTRDKTAEKRPAEKKPELPPSNATTPSKVR